MHFLPGDAGGLALVDRFDVDALGRPVAGDGGEILRPHPGPELRLLRGPERRLRPGHRLHAGRALCPSRSAPGPGPRPQKAGHPPDAVPAGTDGERRPPRSEGIRAAAGRERPADRPRNSPSQWGAGDPRVVRPLWRSNLGVVVRRLLPVGRLQRRPSPAIYAEAVKHGNRHALVAFNPGVGLKHYSAYEDYVAGETNEPFGLIPDLALGGGVPVARPDLPRLRVGPARHAPPHRAVGYVGPIGGRARGRRDSGHGRERRPAGRPHRRAGRGAGGPGQSHPGPPPAVRVPAALSGGKTAMLPSGLLWFGGNVMRTNFWIVVRITAYVLIGYLLLGWIGHIFVKGS